MFGQFLLHVPDAESEQSEQFDFFFGRYLVVVHSVGWHIDATATYTTATYSNLFGRGVDNEPALVGVVLSIAFDGRMLVVYPSGVALILTSIEPVEHALGYRDRHGIVEVRQLGVVVRVLLLEVCHEVAPCSLNFYFCQSVSLREHQQVSFVVQESPVAIRYHDVAADVERRVLVACYQRLYLLNGECCVCFHSSFCFIRSYSACVIICSPAPQRTTIIASSSASYHSPSSARYRLPFGTFSTLLKW